MINIIFKYNSNCFIWWRLLSAPAFNLPPMAFLLLSLFESMPKLFDDTTSKKLKALVIKLKFHYNNHTGAL